MNTALDIITRAEVLNCRELSQAQAIGISLLDKLTRAEQRIAELGNDLRVCQEALRATKEHARLSEERIAEQDAEIARLRGKLRDVAYGCGGNAYSETCATPPAPPV